MPELKPCPFCGSSTIGIARIRHKGPPESLIGKEYCYVECMDCEARTLKCFEDDATPIFGYDSGRSMAVDAWNRRTP